MTNPNPYLAIATEQNRRNEAVELITPNRPEFIRARIVLDEDGLAKPVRYAATVGIDAILAKAAGTIVAVEHLLGVEVGEVVSAGPNDPRITVRFPDGTQSSHPLDNVRLATFDEAELAGYDGTGRS